MPDAQRGRQMADRLNPKKKLAKLALQPLRSVRDVSVIETLGIESMFSKITLW